jgi:hypothetical protein
VRPVTTSKKMGSNAPSRLTTSKAQCAALMTTFGATRLPPQN